MCLSLLFFPESSLPYSKKPFLETTKTSPSTTSGSFSSNSKFKEFYQVTSANMCQSKAIILTTQSKFHKFFFSMGWDYFLTQMILKQKTLWTSQFLVSRERESLQRHLRLRPSDAAKWNWISPYPCFLIWTRVATSWAVGRFDIPSAKQVSDADRQLKPWLGCRLDCLTKQ